MKTARNITLVSLLAAGVFTVPAYAHDWLDRSAVKATVTYTEPNQHGFDFASNLTNALINDYIQFVGTKQEFDWALGLEHRYDDTSRLYIDYDHFDTDEDSDFNTTRGAQRDLFNPNNDEGIASSLGAFDLDVDTLRLGTRHRLKFGHNYNVDLGAGLEWLSADRDFTVTQSSGVGYTGVLREEADFDGVGPFLDVTAKYYMQSRLKGFNLQAYAGAGLLYSETHFTSVLTRVGATGFQPDREVFDREKVKGVSSEVVMKLALGWDYCFSNKSMLSTSLGYMIQHYTDVFDYGAVGGAYSVFFSGEERSAGKGNSSANFPFTRQGPFLEFKWSGMNF
jgi:hypothetical protein